MSLKYLEALSQVCMVSQLIYATMNLHSVVFDSIGNQAYAIPEENPDSYGFTGLGMFNEGEAYISSQGMRRKKDREEDICQAVTCFYGISNIVVPVRSADKYIATIVVGPILTEDPNEILRVHRSFKPDMTYEDIKSLRSALSTLQQQDMHFVEALVQIISMLVNKDTLGTGIQDISVDKLEGVDISISDYPNVVKAAVSYISENYLNNISLNDVARSASVHPTYLSRLFRQYTGCSFREYINRLRIIKARHLLLDPSKSISAISCEVGFFDQSYFTRVFKMIEGVTPGQYRKINLPDYRMLMSFSHH
ncbi:MAG: helix-turn-helix domain-containing protein [Coriobacteriia bacterium]|nr:helix-turn-helix domain-containing protein [Coriobacteriia bacterium]